MSTPPDQFSAARTAQLEAQFSMLRNFTGKAFESAEKVIALNFNTSRDSLEKSSDAVRQLIAAKDPRDLVALSAQTQAHFDSMLAYGRQLLNIAAGLQGFPAVGAPAAPAAAAAAPVPAPVPAAAAPAPAPAAAAAPQPAAAGEPAPEAKSVKPSKKPVVAVKPAAPVAQLAKAKPIARAVGKVTAKPAALPTPAASFPSATSRLASVPPVKPVDAVPPPAPVAGTPALQAKQGELLASKAAKKK